MYCCTVGPIPQGNIVGGRYMGDLVKQMTPEI